MNEILFAQDQLISINEQASYINFRAKHLGVLNVNGNFEKFSGLIKYEEHKMTYVECTIEVGSIDTNNESRDNTLIDKGFMDVKNHPTIEFQSQLILDDQIIGLLNIKGIKKSVNLPYTLDDDRSILISTEISRDYFELEFGSMNGLIGDRIKVELKIVPHFN